MFKFCFAFLVIAAIASAVPLESEEKNSEGVESVPFATVRAVCSGIWGQSDCNYKCIRMGYRSGYCLGSTCYCNK